MIDLEAMRKTTNERSDVVIIAGRVLDRPYADPDDDLAVLARQFNRAVEREEQLRAQLAEAVKERDELAMTDEQVLRKAWLEVCETVGEYGRGTPSLYDACVRVLDVLKQKVTYCDRAVEAARREERAKQHAWQKRDRDEYFSCATCGVVLRADGKNNPCGGPVAIRSRGREGERG